MRVLVTGGNGFIGKYLLSILERKNIDYITIGRSDCNHKKNHISINMLGNESFTKIINEINPTHLIHLAWYTEHGKFWNSPLNLEWIIATQKILEAFYEAGGKHALIAGTCAEYDFKYGYLIEDITPTNPESLYGISKDATRRMSELIAKKYNLKLGWARIFYPYGVGEHSSRLIPALFNVFRNKLTAFGVKKSSYRDLLHVVDVATAIFECSINKVTGNINICSGKPIQLFELVNSIASILGKDSKIILEKYPELTNAPEMIIGSNMKIREIGWQQTICLEEGLKNYLEKK